MTREERSAYNKAYHFKRMQDPEFRAKKVRLSKAYAEKHKDDPRYRAIKVQQCLRYQKRHPEVKKKHDKLYYTRHKEQMLDYSHKRHTQIKQEVIEAYGSKCVCCGITDPVFLSIDHIKGGGRKHRTIVGEGSKFYYWLKKNNWPKEDFRLLCMNCNFATRYQKQCPHQTELN